MQNAEEALVVTTAKEESTRARVETLEEELTKAKKEAVGREEHMKARWKKLKKHQPPESSRRPYVEYRVATKRTSSTI